MPAAVAFAVIEDHGSPHGGQAGSITAVQRLASFNHGFMRMQARDGRLVLSDLRMGMGMEPYYAFQFEATERSPSGWRDMTSRQLR